MSEAGNNLIERYTSETDYMPTLAHYLSTVPPRKLKSDKQLVGVLTRVCLRGMLHDTPFPTISTFSVVSDFDTTNITATLILDDAGATIDTYVELQQYITAMNISQDEQALFTRFAIEAITKIAGQLP